MDDPTTLAIFDFIGDYIDQHGYAPSVRETAPALSPGLMMPERDSS